MAILGIDLETYSAADLKEVGTVAYAEHPSTGVHCAVLILVDGENRHVCRWNPGLPLPAWAVRHLEAGEPLVAHNAGFEHNIIANILTPNCGWPIVQLDSWIDTAQLAACFGLPVSLEGMGAVLGAPVQKDTEGAKLMKRLSARWQITEAEREMLLDYCQRDVEAMLACLKLLPEAPAFERVVMQVDRRINARGCYLDNALAHAMARIADARVWNLENSASDITEEMFSLSSSPALAYYLTQEGVTLPTLRRKRTDGTFTETPSLDRSVIHKLTSRPDLPPHIRQLLDLRGEQGRATSLKKLNRVPKMVGSDGRLRWAFFYGGAHTLRWASRGLQMHNLPKSPKAWAKDPRVYEQLRAAVMANNVAEATMLAPNLLESISWMLRSVVAAPPGRELIGADYSAIEARGIAWMAGQEDVLALFASGQDVYVEDAAKVGSDNRDLGKTCRLGLSYGMSALKFLTTAAKAGVHLDPKEAVKIHKLWRAANPKIVGFWAALQEAFTETMKTGEPQTVGPLTFSLLGTPKKPTCVRVRFPSGRWMHYWRPHMASAVRRFESLDDAGNLVVKDREVVEIRFWRPGDDAKTMTADSTYGGKLAENVIQALCRDIMAAALARLEFSSKPYNVVAHVHDSIVAEVAAGAGDVAEFESILTSPVSWASDFPLAAQGYRNAFFRG